MHGMHEATSKVVNLAQGSQLKFVHGQSVSIRYYYIIITNTLVKSFMGQAYGKEKKFFSKMF